MNSDRNSRGITLIEMMIVVALIAMLAGIAYPSYTAYVQRSNRAAARAVLETAAQYMERQFTINNSYPDVAALGAAGFTVAPAGSSGSAVKYNISLTGASGPLAFTLEAAPVSTSIDPKCDRLTLDNIGNRSSSAGNPRDCWER